MDHHVFDTKEAAEAAEAEISELGGLDEEVIINARTGKQKKVMTSRWAVVRQRADGKWVFPCVPMGLCIEKGFTPERVAQWYTDHPNTVEPYDASWFPEDALE